MNLVSIYLENNILSNTANINSIKNVVKITEKSRAFFLGHPVLVAS